MAKNTNSFFELCLFKTHPFRESQILKFLQRVYANHCGSLAEINWVKSFLVHFRARYLMPQSVQSQPFHSVADTDFLRPEITR
jgi:hypothetical protein